MRRLLLFAMTVFIAVGCGPTKEGTKVPLAKESLFADEIAQTNAISAYDAIKLRRPAFLQSRGPKSIYASPRSTTKPSVYLNGLYHGELETLNTIPAVDVQEIRYIDPRDATLLYGTGHVAGVILVLTKR